MISKNKNDFYQKIDPVVVSDFTLACTLMCLGHEVVSLEPKDINPMEEFEFTFNRSNGIDRLIAGYDTKNLLVEPREFLSARKKVHTKIRDFIITLLTNHK